MPELNMGRWRLSLGKAIVVKENRDVKEAVEHDPTEPTSVALEFMLRSQKSIESEFIQVEAFGFKQQLEYLTDRQTLVDLYTVAYAVTEVRTVITRLRDEVFRRGGEIEPAFVKKCPVCGRAYQEDDEYCKEVDELHQTAIAKMVEEYPDTKSLESIPLVEPDHDEYEKMEMFFKNVNAFEQTFIDVLTELEDDLNIVDDFFLRLMFEYIEGDQEDPDTKETRRVMTHGKLLQILRVDPTSIEFDLSNRGVPGELTWFCLQHRDETATAANENCPQCESLMVPAFYKMHVDTQSSHGGAKDPKVEQVSSRYEYLASWEAIHQSKFTPSRTYGFPPMLTVMDKALTLWGADRLMYAQMYERKLPRGLIVTVTSDTDGFMRQKREIEQRIASDPNYIPWIAIRPAQRATAKTEWVALQPSPKEMQYNETMRAVTQRVAAMWGMPPLYQGDMEGTGGMNSETQQMMMAGHVIEADQRRFNLKVIPKVLLALGIEGWEFNLLPPEEIQVDRELDVLTKRTATAAEMWRLGFELDWMPETSTFKYRVPEGGLKPRLQDASIPEGEGPDLSALFSDNDKGDLEEVAPEDTIEEPQETAEEEPIDPTDESRVVGAAKIARRGGRVRTKGDED